MAKAQEALRDWQDQVAKVEGFEIAKGKVDAESERHTATEVSDWSSHLEDRLRKTVSGQMSGAVVWSLAQLNTSQFTTNATTAAGEIWRNFQESTWTPEMRKVICTVSLDLSGLEPEANGFNFSDYEGFLESFSTTISRMRPHVEERIRSYFSACTGNVKRQLDNAKEGVLAACSCEASRLQALLNNTEAARDDAKGQKIKAESKAPETGDAYRDRIARIEEMLRELEPLISGANRTRPSCSSGDRMNAPL